MGIRTMMITALAVLLLSSNAEASALDSMRVCARMKSDTARLACFDGAITQDGPVGKTEPEPAPRDTPKAEREGLSKDTQRLMDDGEVVERRDDHDVEVDLVAECFVIPIAKSVQDHAAKTAETMQDHLDAGRTHGMFILPYGNTFGTILAPGSICAW